MFGSRKSPKHSAPRRTASGGGVGSGVGSSLRGSRPCAAPWPRGRPSPRVLGSIGCLRRLSSSAPPTASSGAPRRGWPCLGTLCGLRAHGIRRRVGVVHGPAGPRDFPEKRSELLERSTQENERSRPGRSQTHARKLAVFLPGQRTSTAPQAPRLFRSAARAVPFGLPRPVQGSQPGPAW